MKKSIFITLLLLLVVVMSGCKSKEDEYAEFIDKADEYTDAKDYDKAVSTLEKAVDIFPGKAEAYLEIYRVYCKQKDYESAMDILEKAEENIDDDEEYEKIVKKIKALKNNLINEDIENFNMLMEAANVATVYEEVFRKLKDGNYTIEMTEKGVIVKFNDAEVDSDDIFYKQLGYMVPDFADSIKKLDFSAENYTIYVERSDAYGATVKKGVYPVKSVD